MKPRKAAPFDAHFPVFPTRMPLALALNGHYLLKFFHLLCQAQHSQFSSIFTVFSDFFLSCVFLYTFFVIYAYNKKHVALSLTLLSLSQLFLHCNASLEFYFKHWSIYSFADFFSCPYYDFLHSTDAELSNGLQDALDYCLIELHLTQDGDK